LELGSLIGLIVAFLSMIISMLIGAEWSLAFMVEAFVDATSVIIVFGGTIGSVFIAYPFKTVIASFKAFGNIFKPVDLNPQTLIENILELSSQARREGILSLEARAENIDDPFLKKGIMLIVDGSNIELVQNILEKEMNSISDRHSRLRGVWGFIGGAAPAWGMLGTFIGLILMLLNLDDPDALGPGMATALITTFYGAVIANYIALPVESKLKFFNEEEMLIKELLMEGILSIHAGDNPRILEEKLKSFISPSQRTTIKSIGGGE